MGSLTNFLRKCKQALRYETADDNELAKFLVERAVANEVVGNYLYWYVLELHLVELIKLN